MFHQGDLQSGISLAVQGNRHVVCFVSDGSETSKTWENEWLQDETIPPQMITDTAVVLRLEAGSQEASFLAAFTPISETPMIVVIKNGQLTGILTNGIEREDFITKLRAALGAVTYSYSEPSAEELAYEETPLVDAASNEAPAHPVAIQAASVPPESSAPASSDSRPSQAPASSSRNTGRPSDVKPKARKPAASPARSPSVEPESSRPSARQTWIEEQQQRNVQSRRERERVMAQIESDKKARQERRLGSGKAGGLPTSEVSKPSTATTSSPRQAAGRNNSQANIQVRLLDGSTIRSSFSTTTTLSTSIRPWIDSSLRAALPANSVPGYTLKHLMPPGPARSFTLTEEQESLSELGLLPSATLVLVPVTSGFVDAYPGGSVVSGLLSLPYNAASGAAGLVGSVVGGALSWVGMGGGGQHPEPQEAESSSSHATPAAESTGETPASRPSGRPAARFRTMADQRAEDDDTQFYNGNQLNTEE